MNLHAFQQLILSQLRLPSSDTLRKCTRRDLNSREISPARFKRAAYSLFRHWCKINFSFPLLAGNLIVAFIFTSLFSYFILTANTGIEPIFPESESGVLPLHQSARIRTERLERSTMCISGTYSTIWDTSESRQLDLNLWPTDYESVALPTAPCRHKMTVRFGLTVTELQSDALDHLATSSK